MKRSRGRPPTGAPRARGLEVSLPADLWEQVKTLPRGVATRVCVEALRAELVRRHAEEPPPAED